MKITPLEIRQKSFEKVFRGYDKDEVNAYLQSLSMEWEKVIDENRDWKQKVDQLQSEVNKLREVENSLFKTLKTAEDTGATLIEQAKRETELHIRQSQMQGDQIVNEAKEKARKMLDSAENKTKKIMDEMLAKVKTLEHHYHQVHDFREKIIDQLKNYAVEIAEKNEKFENKGKDLDANEILTEAKRTYNETILDIEALSKKGYPEIVEKNEVKPEPTKPVKKEVGSVQKEPESQSDIDVPEEISTETEMEEPIREMEFEVNIPEPAVEDDPDEMEEALDMKDEITPTHPGTHDEIEEEDEEDAKKVSKSSSGSFFDELD